MTITDNNTTVAKPLTGHLQAGDEIAWKWAASRSGLWQTGTVASTAGPDDNVMTHDFLSLNGSAVNAEEGIVRALREGEMPSVGDQVIIVATPNDPGVGEVDSIESGVISVRWPNTGSVSGYRLTRLGIVRKAEAEETYNGIPVGSQIAWRDLWGMWTTSGARVSESTPTSLVLTGGSALVTDSDPGALREFTVVAPTEDYSVGDTVSPSRSSLEGPCVVQELYVSTERLLIRNADGVDHVVPSWRVDKVETATAETTEDSEVEVTESLADKYRDWTAFAWRSRDIFGEVTWHAAESLHITEEGALLADEVSVLHDGNDWRSNVVQDSLVQITPPGDFEVGDKVRIVRRRVAAELSDQIRRITSISANRMLTVRDSDGADGDEYWYQWWNLDRLTAEEVEQIEELARLREQVATKQKELADFESMVRRMAFEAKEEQDYCGELEGFLENIGLDCDPTYTYRATVEVEVKVTRDHYVRKQYMQDEVQNHLQATLSGMEKVNFWDDLDVTSTVLSQEIDFS